MTVATDDPRVLLVEDDPGVRDVISTLIEAEAGLRLVGTADSAEEALALVVELRPDLVLLDDQLTGPLSGAQAAPVMKQLVPGLRVLLCSAFDLGETTADAASIDGYLHKDELVSLVDVARQLLGSA